MATCSHLLHKILAVSTKRNVLLNSVKFSTIKFLKKLSLMISDKNYIDCNKILDCTFEILNCSRYFNVIGSIYITVLNKHILPVSYQLERITPHQWAGINLLMKTDYRSLGFYRDFIIFQTFLVQLFNSVAMMQ